MRLPWQNLKYSIIRTSDYLISTTDYLIKDTDYLVSGYD